MQNIIERNKEHFSFTVEHVDKNGKSRAGRIKTPHGEILTPIFMPVGTHGAMKAQTPEQLNGIGVPIILSNTYHLHLSPGDQIVAKAGGLHNFMGWQKSILTDSGGFQVFSLPNKKITEQGVEFSPHKDKNEKILLGPEKAIQIQQNLGSDIMMAFDECVPFPCTEKVAFDSLQRTTRWLKRCLDSWSNPKQSLFGIVQGSTYENLRKLAAKEVTALDLPGYAIGGVSVGEGIELMQKIVQQTSPLLPFNKPKYVMGVGNPEDLIMLWKNGIDMSDCIIPTKLARSAVCFSFRGRLRLTHRKYRHDFYPIDTNCSCYTCKNFSRAYLKHLFDANEVLSAILATTHNIHFYYELSQKARAAILKDEFHLFEEQFFENYLPKN